MSPDIASRFRGVLLGTFIGDALGRPFEGTPLGGLDRLSAAVDARVATPFGWGYSDDTEMMIGVAESLIRKRAVDGEDILATLAANYEPARGYGKGMKLIVRALEQGEPWQSVASVAWPDGSRGNGGAVRVGPVACLHHDAEPALRAAVIEATRTTHANDIAIEGALLLARAIALLVMAPSPNTLASTAFVAGLAAGLPPAAAAFHEKLQAIERLLDGQRTRAEVVRELGHGVEADESVPLALFALLDAPRAFSEVVLHAIKFGGDTDTIGAMAGALAGALFSDTAIPASWLAALENERRGRDDVVKLADEVFELWKLRREVVPSTA